MPHVRGLSHLASASVLGHFAFVIDTIHLLAATIVVGTGLTSTGSGLPSFFAK